jgi:hypothetical protein
MAVVILGGLVTSTLLNLGLMPALYLAFGRTGTRPEDEEREETKAALAANEINRSLHHPQPERAAVFQSADSAD